MENKTFALTIGDPTGIGPEITARFLKRWADGNLTSLEDDDTCKANLRIYGDLNALANMANVLQITLPETNEALSYHSIQVPSNLAPNAAAGQIAYDSLKAAIADIRHGRANALVTGPISKENLHHAGIDFEGHTEILQAFARRDFSTSENAEAFQSDMLFLYQNFRMLLLTRHVPLRNVGDSLTIDGVCRSLESLCHFLTEKAGLPNARIGMLGVNPHAGESMGQSQSAETSEEARILKPAIDIISNRFPSIFISSPLAADGAFRGFNAAHPAYDAYVAPYHDQGLIPFKMAAGLQAVNVTIGLPFLRTSVSHGTAPDIAGQGIASEESLIAAYYSALDLLKTAH